MPARVYRLAIFDLDGTLVDTVGDLGDAVNFALGEMGLPAVGERDVREMVGEGVVKLLERALHEHASRVDEALPMFRARYLAHLVDRTRPYPGIPELLAAAPQQKAVATNKPGNLARQVVSELGLAGHFFRILGDGDVSRRKPDPQVIEILLAECGARRDEAVLIGDGVVDVRTARAAGVDCCAVTWGYVAREALLAEQPTHITDSVSHLAGLLGG